MKKQILIILIAILSIQGYSQITYKKGYFIQNNDKKIECWIKNIDWKNNPTEFKYKLSENSEQTKGTIEQVKEFGIFNNSKYIRNNVNIDRSSKNLNNLSNNRNPIFKKEKLFLKVLIEGKSNLYGYFENNLKRYFYKIENSTIKQLICKSYKTLDNHINENNEFRQQLWNDLKCPSIDINKIKSIDYTKKDLIKFFTLYNNCHDTDIINFEKKEKKDFFNLTFRPRINSSSLTMTENYSLTSLKTDYGNKTGLGIGIELEFILPFNNDKWGILIEPTYQNFKYKKTTQTNEVFGGELTDEVDYSSIEIPVSLRYYVLFNKKSKIFVNASIVTDFSLKSSFEFTRKDGSTINSLEIESNNNLAMGFGYKYNDKYSFEIRYQTSREILEKYSAINTDFKTLSIIFGYSLL